MTHRLPVLLLLASAVIALPERASAQETAVTSLTAFCDTVTAVVPDDSTSAFIGESDVTSLQPAVFADAIVVPKSETPPADSSTRQSCAMGCATGARGASTWLAGAVRGIRDAAGPRCALDG